MKILITIIEIIMSYMRIIFYKILYGNKVKINLFKKIYFGKNLKIKIKGEGKLIIKGNFICRDNNIINIYNGVVILENNIFLNNGNSINCHKKIILGQDTILGEGIKIYDHDHIFNEKILISKSGYKSDEIEIGSNVWIGSNSILLRGTKIGNNCVIGAGTLIKEKIEDGYLCFQKRNLNKKEILYKKI